MPVNRLLLSLFMSSVLIFGMFAVQSCILKKTPVKAYKTSEYWSKRNAVSGSLSAQKMMGSMYYLGEGVPKDLKKAYAWYKLAADQGDSGAEQFVNIIIPLLDSEQLVDAEKLLSILQSEAKRN